MRTIHTFILRLLVDTVERQAIHGVIRAVADDNELAFTDEQSLLALLRRMSGCMAPTHDENDTLPTRSGGDGLI